MKKVSTQMLIPKESVGSPPGLGGKSLFLLLAILVQARASATSKNESGQPLASVEILTNSSLNDTTTDANGGHVACPIVKNQLNQI